MTRPTAPVGRPFRVIARGFEGARPAERAAFGELSAFAVTVVASRGVNYVRERRRSMPRLRSVGRRIYHSPGQSQVRVHHFTVGLVILLAAGAASIATRSDSQEMRFALPFGAGTGLALDEIGLLLELDNPYWNGEKFAFAQSAVAALAAAVLLAHFYRKGRAGLDDSPQGCD